jgi:hypothetical protein
MLAAMLRVSVYMLPTFYLIYVISVVIHMRIFIAVRTCEVWLDFRLAPQWK